ncbi:C45 family peptidase [Paenalkalicoccus suaedae]
MNVYSHIYSFKGTHYDFGIEQSKHLRQTPLLQNRKKQWDKRSRHFRFIRSDVEEALRTIAPGIWEELTGLSDGLHISMDEAIKNFGGYYMEIERSGCSIYADTSFLVRNYDSHPLGYEGRFSLFNPTDKGYASIGPTMQVTGRTDGMNEKGLSIGYNFVNRRNRNNGFLCNMIARIVLENAATVDEAVQLLKELPHRNSFNYVVSDGVNEPMIVEASPEGFATRTGFSCTNHYDLLLKENRYRTDDSENRHAVLQQHPNLEGFDAFKLLNNEHDGVFSKKYDASAGTLHTAVYFTKEQKVGFALGGNRLPLMIDFGAWLRGKKMHATKVKGAIDSTNPFVSMLTL